MTTESAAESETQVFIGQSPGREAQAIGTANFLGTNPEYIYGQTVCAVGNLGDSQCYLGVRTKVEAIQDALAGWIDTEEHENRLIPPFFTGGVSDGQLNGTDRMRFSLVGREVSHDGMTMHFSGSDVEGTIAVVACDKPPVGTLAAILEHNAPAIIMSDGSIHPGIDPETDEPIDIVTGFQSAGNQDPEYRRRIAMNACPGYGSCGGMFTYNTMQSFIGALGMEPINMVSPASDDPRRLDEFPTELVQNLQVLMERNIKPSDIVTPASLRNAMVVAMALGGSTNVVLHAPEIARSAGYDFWTDVMSQEEFNLLSLDVPVMVNARPFGEYSMVDIDEKGGLQVIIKELLDAGKLDGSCLTCTGETLQEQIDRLAPRNPDGDVIHSVDNPYKKTGGLRLLSGNIAPDGGAVIKMAGVERGLKDGVFTGNARVFNSEADLIRALSDSPDIFEDNDMVVIRYAGPRGAPGMPEMLDPTSRITALCNEREITIGLMTDARFSGGSVGLVVGHVSPEASEGGPIALIEDGDTIRIDVKSNTINCDALDDTNISVQRIIEWERAKVENGGVHPNVPETTNRLLVRQRHTARTALQGAGWES